ncbi:multiple epidermal growth factor-like domains protein 11 [Littorina saxatilis]|uniref:multiple epidermal growth factor-like domains protein 11 n=1 Tax=Littorina saxatilis TaxID=31220 RepID=UPI0038B5108D
MMSSRHLSKNRNKNVVNLSNTQHVNDVVRRTVNVAINKTYSQISTYSNNGAASNAADNDTEGSLGANTCSHTNSTNEGVGVPRNEYHWWQVDLGRIYPVHNITVWARKEKTEPILFDRLYPFIITVDNKTCVNVTSPQNNTIRSNSVMCSSVMYGQVVRLTLTTNRTLNLCEFQIFVCKDGFYGLDCSSPCDKNCDEGCNMTSGFCTRCKEGFWGLELCHHNCSAHCAGPACQRDDGNCEVCREGFYGPDCSFACHQNCVGGCNKISGHCTRCPEGKHGSDCLMDCGNCRGDSACNATSGVCPGGCAPGWTKPLCTEVCPSGSFGDNCSMQCTNCSQDRCHNTDGECLEGCKPGYQWTPNKTFCNEFCQNGSYGDNCSEPCGHCSGDEQCDPFNGTCDACQLQFQPPYCKVCTGNRYGASCELNCSMNCGGDGSCEKDTGRCVRGCKAGYRPGQSGFCNETCKEGKYGEGCSHDCGNCNGACRHEDGHCAAGCMAGYEGDLCAKLCTGNRYGASCELNCSMNCGGDGSCEQDTGRCVGGCKAGYRPGQSGFCNETCEDGKYGEGCSHDCGNCNGACRHEDGHCAAGCMAGYEGDLCAKRQVSSSRSNTPLIGGAAGGVVVLIALCVVIAIIIIRRRKQKPKARSAYTESSSETANGSRETTLSFDPVTDSEALKSSKPSAAVKPMVAKKPSGVVNQEDSGHIYYNTADIAAHQQSTPAPQAAPASAPTQDPADYDEATEGDNVYYNNDEDVYASFKASQPKLDAVQKYLVDALASGKLKEEFATLESMPEGVPQEVALLKKNFKKNRFAAILPYDRNLVVLRDGYSEGTATDFVNASYVSVGHATFFYLYV